MIKLSEKFYSVSDLYKKLNIVELNNVNGGSAMTYTHTIKHNGGILVIASSGIVYKTVNWSPSTQNYYGSKTFEIVNAGTVPTIEITNNGLTATISIGSYHYAKIFIF